MFDDVMVNSVNYNLIGFFLNVSSKLILLEIVSE